jgi:putative ABC transport system substrate-binding protein
MHNAALVAWPLAARAQEPALPVIGFLSSGWQQFDAFRLALFRQGLNRADEVIERCEGRF